MVLVPLMWFCLFSHISCMSQCIKCHFSPSSGTITIDVAVGIAVGTGTIAFVVGALLVLLYHCISKHRSQLKPESSSHQQQRVDSEYKESPISGREKFELRDNVAYLPVRH